MSYHHGALRDAVLAAAAETIAAHGVTALNLRELARTIGVAHTAPRHHFTDKRGVLTALAAQGYGLLAGRVAGAGSLVDSGVAYVRFAREYPGHFPVMFAPDLVDDADESLVAARAALAAALGSQLGAAEPLAEGAWPPRALAAWSIAHGLATLLHSGTLDVRDADLDAWATDVLRHLG